MRARHRDQLALDAAIQQVVGRLLGHEAVEAEFFGRPQRFHHLPGGKGAGAEIAHFARAHQVIQRAQRLVDGDIGLGAVNLVEVDIVGLQAAQRGVALLDDVTAVIPGGEQVVIVHAPVNFGGQHDPVALAVALERLADNGLAGSPAVNIGRIQKVDTGFERAVDDGKRIFFGSRPAKVHTSQTQRADRYTGSSQGAIFHEQVSFVGVQKNGSLL